MGISIIDALKQVTTSIKEWTDENKVTKISGKGLSTNDYTDADKDKLDNINQIPNDLVVLDNKLYLAQDGAIMDESAVTLPTGGGGGTSAAITLTNNLSSSTITSIVGGDVLLEFNYSSSEDENGTAYVYVDDVLKTTVKISTGDNTINIGAYVKEGTNIIKLTCIDQYSNSKNLSYTAEILSLQLSSVFDSTIPYDSDINYTYIPIINMAKTVHFILDGVEIGTEEITTSGRQETYIIPKPPHGSHTFEVYFTVKINETEVPSNHLYYDLICITNEETTPIISCSYNNSEITQFETITIPYIVYSPSSLTSDITLSVNGNIVSELTVDRTKQNWSFRADEYGELTLTITCGAITKTLTLNVNKSEINVEATTNNLELYLSSYGRSNNEIDPAVWNYNDISCVFENYNWVSDGWLTDENGYVVHRVSGNARLTIPLQMFADDFRTTGKTIEFEFQTKDIRNYDAEIISCYSGGIGFKLTAQEAILKSEQTEISTQYKEDEHIRVAFVVEKRTANRLVLIYLNGIMCGAAQYPIDDDFSQASPVEISIGSNDCTIDLYNVRIYNNDLTRYQILDNWIADTQDIALKAERYDRNNIFDAYGDIVIENLPDNLPYIVLKCSKLPQTKNDKLNTSGKFIDPVNPDQSFEFTDAQIAIQGTSSAGYARKNYKLKLKNGLIQNGVVKNSYQMQGSELAASVFCFKADVASSEGANNVELVKQYNDISPYKTPSQQENPDYRQGITGFPMVIFHDDGSEIKFIGKYNFNFDKSSGHWGFKEGDESWELKNNTSDRVIWKSADFDDDDWKNDFEAMYPDEDYDNISRLKEFAEWVVSTDREAATNVVFETPVVIDSVEYTADTAEYRLAKFKHELEDYCEVDSAVFYYLFSLLYLSIDTRAKNTFPSWQGDSKLYWIAYDWDSTVGCDNVGSLKFGYELEDIDILPSGATPFNGQDSVFWCNVRDAYVKEISTMYQNLRSTDKLSYEITEKAYEDHQAVWPEAIWNEDAFYKYLQPLIEDGAGIYLPMLQGSKSEQRKWWLYNRFKYMDSKYNAGDALKDFITLRGYAKSDITITPYADIYASIKYGSYLEQTRALRGSSYTLECPLDNVNDTEIYIYSASQLKDVGDLSGLKVGLADFSMATKLQNLKVGDADSEYNNGNLKSLTLGNNVLLKTIDARNCSALGTGEQQSLDISGCANIEEIYLTGTALKGVAIPDGGILKVLHLPDTITNLTIRNQSSLTDFVLNDSSNLTTLRLENVGSLIDTPSVINNMADGGRIRILDMDWEVDSESDLVALLEKLIKMRGLDENGNNLDAAVLTGRIRVNEKVSDEIVGEFYNYFVDVVIDDGSEEIYIINYKDWNGVILHSMRLAEGGDAINPITEGYISTPTRDSDEYYSYEFTGWSTIPTNVSRHHQVIALYATKVAINFAVDGKIIHSDYVIYGTHAEDPVVNGTIDPPVKEGTDDLQYAFNGWDGSLLNITLPRTVNALFANVYPVRFYSTPSSPTPHHVQWVKEGEDAHDPSTDEGYTTPPDILDTDIEDKKYVFSAWDNLPTSVTSICKVYATYDSYWAVRFYNEPIDGKGYKEVDVQWIKETYSAVDPITRAENPIEKPTKESTAQYDFTFSVWEGDYTNVTEARKIYAVYNNTTRRYNVYFCNMTQNNVLYTVENVLYGGSANYYGPTPTKMGVDDPENYVFMGWSPLPEKIEGETYCYALFRYNAYLFGKLGEEDQGWGTIEAPNWSAINSYWTQIDSDVDAFKNNSITEDEFKKKYPIGGRMLIPVIVDGAEYNADVEIIEYNHDNLADGSGKATLTFMCKNLPGFRKPMYGSSVDNAGWEHSTMREFCNGELFNTFPTELQAIIEPVLKISDGGEVNRALVTTTDKCWLASYPEVGFASISEVLPGQGEVYASTYSTNKNSRVKYLPDGYTPYGWWLRSSSYSLTSDSALFCRVQASGILYGDIETNKYAVVFGFCIGKGSSNAEIDAKQTAILGDGELGTLILGRGE